MTNNDIARTAGLLAVAVLPGLAGITEAAYASPDQLTTGFHHAVLIAAALCALGGVLSWLLISNDVLDRRSRRSPGTHCEPSTTPIRAG